ncbi:transglycosylase domain-containing protein [Streptomyces sp. NPDC005963]|uniref:transglycosylase domain-containing protein n=1 Tax=Streptomyces sp. NPDC005963 TaxID=3156721 RepID=UPI0033F4AA7D
MGRAEARRARETGARQSRRAATPQGIRRFFTWRKLLGTFLGLCLLLVGAFFVVYLLVPVPTANAHAEMQSNVYKYSDGKILTRTGKVNREIIGLEKIPEDVRYTFVAAENKSFYKDHGVDLKGTTRALVSTVTGRGKQGGSTITQQYVKNYYLDQDQTVTRKLKELVIALKVDREKSKDEILAGYINTSYYGRGAYGIQAAAQAYYGVDAGKLTLAQGAYLAALLQAPSQYDWAVASDTGKKLVTERWRYTLNNMVEEGRLDAAERDRLTFPVPKAPKAAPGMEGQTGYLVEAANAELVRQGVSEEDIKAGGWTITLTVDSKRQKALEKSVQKELEAKLDRKGDKKDATVQAGATSVDPETGAVVALYGGIGATEHWLSNATRRDYTPASTFKPVVLASALENEAKTQDDQPIGLNTIYDGTSKRPVEGSDTPFDPENEDDRDWGPVSVQKATNSSINSVYAQMIVDVGPDKTKKTALDLGMRDGKDWPERPAMSLGTMHASTWDMAGVYATLDNHGKKVTPTILKSAEHQLRKPDLADPIGKQVISRGTADTVTSALEDVVRNGSGRNAQGDYDAAGKTGTAENNFAAWFVGYTPKLVTAVALFGEKQDGTGRVTLTDAISPGRTGGGGYPARIWQEYTAKALGQDADARFDLEVKEPARSEPEPEPSVSNEPSPTPSKSSEPTDDPSPSRSEAEPEPSAEEPSPSRSEAEPEPSTSSSRSTEPNPKPSRSGRPTQGSEGSSSRE